ncbi:MAG: methyltransferase, partial [Mesorhizobium sp.]
MMAASTALAPDTPAHTVDAFHRGRFWLVQPRQGHRAGMDAMMLAAAVPS